MGVRTSTVAVTGVGMVSSLGHGVVPSCAAARAGISRAAPLPGIHLYDGDSLSPEPLMGHPVPGAEGFEGAGKLAVLGAEALHDLRSQEEPGEARGATTGLLLALNDGYFLEETVRRVEQAATRNNVHIEVRAEYEERRRRLERHLLPRLVELSGAYFHPGFQQLYFEGQAGFIHAVADAVELLRTRTLTTCIVGGADSYLEPELLKALLQVRALKTPERHIGFIPGEGAAFVRLERTEEASRRGASILAVIEAPTVERGAQHRFSAEPPSGIALSAAITRAFKEAAVDASEVGWIMGSLNGDTWRAREWGMALMRAREHVGQAALWNPAESFGEVGAATAAFSLCAAVRAFQRGYARGRRILIWASSENGLQGALFVRAADRHAGQEDGSRG